MKKKSTKKTKINTILAILILAAYFLMTEALATNSSSSEQANLTIWAAGAIKQNLTYGTIYSKNASYWNFYFYTNFTNSSNYPINETNGNGNCTIEFNESETWTSPLGIDYDATF